MTSSKPTHTTHSSCDSDNQKKKKVSSSHLKMVRLKNILPPNTHIHAVIFVIERVSVPLDTIAVFRLDSV